MKEIIVLSDMQIPYHHRKAVVNVMEFVADFQPDEIACVGDEIDHIETSHWSKGSAAEYEPTLQRTIDRTIEVMSGFRKALGIEKPMHVMRSNHGDRLEKYVGRYAPALRTLKALRTEELLSYDRLEITYHRKLYDIAPGWLLAHGDEGTLSRYAGGTAIALARRTGRSVVCGHTHRAGIIPHSVGYNGRVSTLYGMEVGHLMSLSGAGYLKTGAADWQSAFGILHITDRGTVIPELVPIKANGSFEWGGELYG